MQLKCCSRWSSVESALFCPQCTAVRCYYCTIHEPVAWFCQQCLTESTKLGARSSGNHCVRNCVQCPECSAFLRSKPQPPGHIKASCVSCNYSFLFKEGIPLAKQAVELNSQKFREVQKVVNGRFPAQNLLGAPALADPSAKDSPVTGSSEEAEALRPPIPARLRAKTAKLCRKCGFTLVDPERQPKSASHTVKHSAISVIPLIELYKTADGVKLVGWHTQAAKVALVSELAVVDLDIPPSTLPGFKYPLFLVERETIQSRQAFMAGNKSKLTGPGWAVSDIDAEELDSTDTVWVCMVSGVKLEIKPRVAPV